MSYVQRMRSVRNAQRMREEVRARQASVQQWREPITVDFVDISGPQNPVVPFDVPVVKLDWEEVPKGKPKARQYGASGKDYSRLRRMRPPLHRFAMPFKTPQDYVTEGFMNMMNNVPGFAQQVPMNMRRMNIRPFGLPVYRYWGNEPWNNSWFESWATSDTRQTGQAITLGNFMFGTPGTGSYLSFYSGALVNVGGLYQPRGDEQVTFGPTPAGYVLRRPWFGAGENLAWGALPSDLVASWWYPARGNTWPQGTTATNGQRAGGPPTKRPDTLKWVPRRPPYKGMKERKVAGPKGLMALMQFLNGATEMNDLANAFYDALPEHLKLKRPTELQKKQQLYKYWNEVDLTSGLVNAALNQLTDMIWAQLGINTKHANIRYGGAMGANKLLSQAFGDAWKDVVDQVESTARKSFTALTGHELRS